MHPSKHSTSDMPLSSSSPTPDDNLTCSQVDGVHKDSEVINLLDYLEVIVKRRNLICGITVAAVILSIAVALMMPRIYSSSAWILPPQQDTGMMGIFMGQIGGGAAVSSLAGDLLGKGTPSDLYAKILESEAIKDPIIDRFNVMTVEKAEFRVFAYDKLDRKVQIEVGKKDGIISITVDDKDPKRAADMANAYVEELGKLAARLNSSGASSNKRYLEERLAKVKVDFDKVSDQLKTFQTKYKTLDITEQAKGTIRGVAELEGMLAAEEVKLATMRRIYTHSSQDIKNQQTVIANIKTQIARLEGNKGAGGIPGIGSIPAIGQDYLRLMREYKMQETLLELLTKQFELAKLNEEKNVSTIQVIQTARVSDKSLKPSKRKFVIMITAAAFVLSILIAFAQEAGEAMDAGQKERSRRLFRQLISFRRDA